MWMRRPGARAARTPAPRLALPLTLALALLVTAAAGGCARIEATVRAQEALTQAGLQGPVVAVQERGGETIVQVRYNSRAPDAEALAREIDLAAQGVWAHATVALDRVTVTPDHNPTMPDAAGRAFTREELTSRFGPRPEGLDQPPGVGGPRAAAFGVVAVLVGLVVVGAAVLLAVLFLRIRRQHRQRVAEATAWPGTGPPGPGRRPHPGPPGPPRPAPGVPPASRPPAPAGWQGPPGGQAGPPPPGSSRPPSRPAPPPGSWPAPPDER